MRQNKQLLTIQQGADFLGIHPGTLRHWAQNNTVKGVKIGTRGDWRFTKKSLTAATDMINNQQVSGNMMTQFTTALMSQGPDAVASTDQHGVIKSWNKSSERLFGLKRKDIVGKPLEDVFPKEEKETIREIMNGVMQGKIIKDYEVESSTAKGNKIIISIYIHRVKSTSGRVLGTVVIFRDITGSKKIEDALHESENKFQASFEQTMMPVSISDLKANWLLFNKAYSKMFGYSKNELKRLHPTQLIHPHDIEKSKRAFEKLVRGNSNSVIQERRYIHKNGSVIYGIVNATLIKRSGEPHIVVTVIEDVTKRKKTERLLKDNMKKFRTLIEGSTDVIQLISREGKIVYTSESVKKVLGYTPQELLGKTEIPYLHPQDAERFYAAFASIMKNHKKQITLEYRVRHKNGSWVWIEATGVNHLENPAIRAIVGNFRDISKRKLLELQKEEFLGIVSHELKTPVTSLKVFAQVLQNKFTKEGDAKSALLLGKMDAQINKLTNLIHDLLDVSKIESGRLKFEKTLFSLDTLIQETIEEIQRTTEIHTIVFKNKSQKVLFADKDRIGQVIINFLTNAIKYSPTQSQIIVNANSQNNEIIVSVQDFGLGIPKEQRSNIFDKFFRVSGKKFDTIPGMGLGLHISAEIIRNHKGKIWVESEFGKGSTFCFSLPLNKQIAKNGPHQETERML